MKSKIIFILPIILMLFGGANSKREETREYRLEIKEDVEYDSKSNFLDSLNVYTSEVKNYRKSIGESLKVIDLNQGYEKNLIEKQEKLKTQIDTLLVDIVHKVESKVYNKSSLIDSICVEQRGFIGNKIFGREKCRTWKYKRYYLKNGNKIYID